MLFYGPPGTGKTTTILNLICDYQKISSGINKSLEIHLNASDERGIDTIRSVISEFTSTNGLFKEGMKFVILDEVDSMTKNAQQALKILIQKTRTSTRFCLITNYLSKVDISLRNYCVSMRFNQLPVLNIIETLNKINVDENVGLDKHQLETIQKRFCSDMRSMINYMQMIQINMQNIITDTILEEITSCLIKQSKKAMINLFDSIVLTYNISIIEIIKAYCTYIIRNHKEYVTKDFVVFTEKLLHCNCKSSVLIKHYFIIHMKQLLLQ